VREELIHTIGQKGAHEEMCDGRFEQRRLVRARQLQPYLVVKKISPLRTDSLPFVSKIYWPENADDAIMDAP
jgi:hypothetical protein